MKTETDFLLHLAKHGVPVARPIETRGGEYFVRGEAPEGAREGVLFEDLGGRAVDPGSTSDARANGKTLAMLHNAAERYTPANAFDALDLDHLLHRPLERLRNSMFFKSAAAFYAFEAIALRAAERIDAFGTITKTYCHGDCHGFNARVLADGSAAFYDFDDSGPGYLAYDLAVFLWAKVSFGRALHHMWDAFVDGYCAVRPIKYDDLEAAHDFVIVRHVWLLGEHASRASEWGSENVSYIPKETTFLKRWEETHRGGHFSELW